MNAQEKFKTLANKSNVIKKDNIKDFKRPEISECKDLQRSSFPSTSFVSWTIFFLCCAVFLLVWGIQLKEFDGYASGLENYFANLSDTVVTDTNVLGIEDENDDSSTQIILSQDESTLSEDQNGGGDNAVVLSEGGDSEELDIVEGGLEMSSDSDRIVAEMVDDIETERKQTLREKLKLQLPYEIDNPNYPITFISPHEDHKVEIQINGDGFNEIESPFLLPSLSIGMHTLNFRFRDEDEVLQNFEEKIIIVPRAPDLKSTTPNTYKSDAIITFEGTSLPNSDIFAIVAGEPSVFDLTVLSAISDAEGNWSIVFEDFLDRGSYSVVFLSKKLGYTSKFSQSFQFSVGSIDTSTNSRNSNDNTEDDVFVTDENYPYILGGFAAGALLLLLLVTLFGRRRSAIAEDARLFNKINGKEESQITSRDLMKPVPSLREKFLQSGINVSSKLKSSRDISERDDSAKEDTSGAGDAIGDVANAHSLITEDEKSFEAAKDKDLDEEKDSALKTNKKKSKGLLDLGDDSEDDFGTAKKDKSKVEPSDEEGDSLKENDSKKVQNESEEVAKTEKSISAKDRASSVSKDSNVSDKKEATPIVGKVYKKSAFLEKFKDIKGSDTNKISITLTSKGNKES